MDGRRFRDLENLRAFCMSGILQFAEYDTTDVDCQGAGAKRTSRGHFVKRKNSTDLTNSDRSTPACDSDFALLSVTAYNDSSTIVPQQQRSLPCKK